MKKKEPHPLENLPIQIGSFFLDSGAHSIYVREIIKKNWTEGYAFYKTEEFAAYVRSYAKFVLKYGWAIDYYANVDAIRNPELTYEIQKQIEGEYGLKPVPVIHYATPEKWIFKYIEDGHTLLGIGGVGQGITAANYIAWADRLFTILCPQSAGRKPVVRTHGFAMTSWTLTLRYPWWSVDSSSWIKAAAYGSIYIPHKRNGKWIFNEKPYTIATSNKSSFLSDAGKHISNLSKLERHICCEWLELHGEKLGKADADGNEIERGVVTHHRPRAAINLAYYRAMVASLPAWPWPIATPFKRGFFDHLQPLSHTKAADNTEDPIDRLRIYYSGNSSRENVPEYLAREHDPAIMLTFHDMFQRKVPDTMRRFRKYQTTLIAQKRGEGPLLNYKRNKDATHKS